MATRNRGLSNYAAQAIRWAQSLAQKSSRTVLWIATASIIFLLFLINFRGSTHYVPESCGSAPDFDSPWTPLGGNTNAPQLSDLVVQRKNSHGEMIKVLFVVISSSVSPVVCRNVASAFLSGVPVAVVSNGKQPFRYEHKLNFTLRASEEAGLGEKDVVVYMDSDTMFTGMNPFHFIDRFINLSPESPDKMHVGAIRNSTTMSPMIFSSESLCSSWTTFGLGKTCEDMFESIRGLVGTYYAERIKDRFGYVYDVNRYNKTLYPTQYLNSGTVVARIWAAKEMNKAIRRAVDVRINGSRKPESVSIDDQSFIHYVYHDLLLTELHFNSVLENRGVSQFGLHAGLLDVDIHQEISTLPWGGTGLVELNLRSWSGSWTHVMQRKGDDPYAPEDPNGDFVSRCPFHESIAKFLRPVLQSTGPQITRREYTVGGTVLASILAPPLFSRSEQKDIGYVYPFIRHYPSTNKILRMDSEAPFMAWGVPVLFDAAARRNANTLLRSLRIVIHSAGEDVAVQTHQYTDVCPFPFASWGLQEIY